MAGGFAWYWRFLHRLPTEFATPVDEALAGGRTDRFIEGWGGGSHITRTPSSLSTARPGAAWNWGIARALFRLWGYQPGELWALTYGWGGGCVDPNGVETRDDSVDENLADLDGFVNAVLAYVQQRDPSIQQVDIVGHSMGGVLARKWMQAGNAGRVRRLVTLDSPHHGIAGWWLREDRCADGWTRFCQDFEIGSPWLAALNQKPEIPPGVRALAVYDGTGQYSFNATPLSPALEGADNLAYNRERGARVRHIAYVYDPGVLREVFEWLSKE
ncbi:MAG: alpha/beta fold hydrolase [Anaerolineae bacterium]|nr:alpha/beta fold hydrolase [Anaerolineae bacterium]